ncbi:unnamed protein product [Adineta steineri]|uniref:Tyrosine specific protein phosphatases domain-containing protein n=1 Tax=Adineta steineri TaxID=433720 RepID=A0A819GP53_9BILA|nr:unnamed protein product [Adineta steineri]CAF1039389.1 unnamed protein product [Adineta steineri]CAF3885100.1 unnamed protein product [Adineta steineri]CAF3963362.1 unnamed protein product [Adineta steineri]
MLLIQSPSIIFAFIFSIFSIILTILTFNIGYNHPKHHIQFLIILPPLNSVFLFLLSLTWIERRFRLSYIPFICLVILLISSITLTIVSYLFLSLSIIIYLNLIFYSILTSIVLLIILIVIISYLYGSINNYQCRTKTTIDQQNNELLKNNNTFQVDKLVLNINENELILFMSYFPGRHTYHDIQNIVNDLNQINVDSILTLNETKELSFMNITNDNRYNMDTYSTYIKRANIEHIIYPIRKRFIPKSISDYMQFLYGIINNINRCNYNRLLVHCMSGLGRTGMTIVCFELLYEYIMNENERKKGHKFIERFCHYPLLLENYCRVCKSISNVRRIRPGSIHNPLQILFAHEFYARLKSESYMQQITEIINLNEKRLLDNFEELRLPTNI